MIANSAYGKDKMPFDISVRRIEFYHIKENDNSTTIKKGKDKLYPRILSTLKNILYTANPLEKDNIVNIYTFIHNRIVTSHNEILSLC